MMYLLNGLPAFFGTINITGNIIISGQGLFADGTAAAPSISFLADPDTGFHRVSAGNVAFDSNGVVSLYFGSGGIIQAAGFAGYLTLAAVGSVALTAGGTNQNITLTPSGTGSLSVPLSTGTVSIGPTGGSSALFAASGGLEIQSAATFQITFRPNATEAARFNAAGRFLLGTTSDTGELLQVAGSAYMSGSIYTGAGSYFGWSSRGGIDAPSDGVFRLTNTAGTGFTRLQFGGTTASFPALKRNAAILQCVLADDTAFAGMELAQMTANGAAIAVAAGKVSYGGTTATTVGAAGGASALPATPLGYIICNVAGTQVKVPYYNN